MSNEPENTPQPTKPIAQHAWLQKLVGEWRSESEMMMGPGEECQKGHGHESVRSLGGLWAYAEGTANMPDGSKMTYYSTLGYDVSFNEYRGCWFADMSSHLWKQVGTLSDEGRVMTLNCEGPNMFKDGETANYRDVIELVDDNTRTLTSYGEQEDGTWMKFMSVKFTRV